MSGPSDDLLHLGARPVADLRRLQAPLPRDLLDRRELLQPVHRRQHHVVRVGRAEALRQDVADPRALHDRAHRATGDHAGAGRRRLHQHRAGAVLADDLVRDRAARQRHRHHAAARRVHGLAHRLRHLVRLARREADAALPVADSDERVEREAPAALHDLRHAVDRDHVLDEIAALAAPAVAPTGAALAVALATATPTLTAAAIAAAGTTPAYDVSPRATWDARARPAAAGTTGAAPAAAGATRATGTGAAGTRPAALLIRHLIVRHV